MSFVDHAKRWKRVFYAWLHDEYGRLDQTNFPLALLCAELLLVTAFLFVVICFMPPGTFRGVMMLLDIISAAPGSFLFGYILHKVQDFAKDHPNL